MITPVRAPAAVVQEGKRLDYLDIGPVPCGEQGAGLPDPLPVGDAVNPVPVEPVVSLQQGDE